MHPPESDSPPAHLFPAPDFEALYVDEGPSEGSPSTADIKKRFPSRNAIPKDLDKGFQAPFVDRRVQPAQESFH